MSRWILQSAASGTDPISFERLVQLLADETISETDLLRSEDQNYWQTVDSVIGLRRAAEKLRASNAAGAAADISICSELIPPAPNVTPGSLREVAVNRLHSTKTNKHAVTRSDHVVPAKPLSWYRILALCGGICVAAWCCWSLWFESRRFPKPAHIANNPEPLILPWMGSVSGFEAILMTVDAVAILAFAIWWFRSKPKH